MKFKSAVCFLSLFLLGAVSASADFARGGFNGWDTTAPMDANAGNTFYTVTRAATASGSGLKFDLEGNWGTAWGAGTAATPDSTIGSASKGGGDLTFSATQGTYYTFRLAGWYLSNPRRYAIMSTDAEPVAFSGATDDHASQFTDAVTVTASFETAPSSQEKVYIVYTVNNWTNRSLVAMTKGTGSAATSATGTIPAQTAGTKVEYYVFTSTFTLTSTHLTDNAIATVWSDSGTETSIPTADFVTLTRYPDGRNNSYTVTAKTLTPAVTEPTGNTTVKLGSAFSLAYTAVNFTGTPAWTYTLSPTATGAAVAPASGTGTTFTWTPEAAGAYTLKVIATAGGVSATNTATLTVTAPDFANCWHQPDEYPPGWNTPMREPPAPAEGAAELFLAVGNYTQDGAMSSGAVYVSFDGGATWTSHALAKDSQIYDDEFWACRVDISALEEGDEVQYAIEVKASGKDTTFLGTTNQIDGEKYGTLAAAKANPYEVVIGAAPVVEPDYGNCWHIPTNKPDFWEKGSMRFPVTPAEGATNLFLAVGNYQESASVGNMTAGTVWFTTDGTTWTNQDMEFNSQGNNGYYPCDKIWSCELDISALVEGDELAYVIQVDYSDHDTTYLGTTNQDIQVKYPTLAAAKENPFFVIIGPAPLLPGDVYHDDWSYQPWTNEPATHMREMPGWWVDAGLPIPLRMADRTAEATAAFIEYRIGEGAWTEIEMAPMPSDGTWASDYATFNYWTNSLPAMSSNNVIEYYFKVLFTNSTKLGTTFLYRTLDYDEQDNLIVRTTLDEAEARMNPFRFVTLDPSGYMINAWHYPTNYEPWASAQMREPLAPKEGEAPYLRLGNAGETGEGYDTYLTSATIKYRVDDGEWNSLAMGWEQKASEEGEEQYRSNAYWTNALPAASEGAVVKYYFATECTNSTLRDTYVYSDGGLGCEKSFSEEAAKAAPFSYTVGAAPVLPLAEHVWHEPTDEPEGKDGQKWTTPMRNPLALTEGVANVAVFVGTYQADSDGENMTGGKIFYAINGGAFVSTNLAWSDSDMRNARDEGWLKFWKYDIDTSGIAEGGTLAYYFVANVEGRAPTYIISDGAEGCVLTNAVDPETDALFTATCGERVYNLGNCWHNPGNFDPWPKATMRNPCYPSLGEDVCFFVGNQRYGDGGNPGNLLMDESKLFWRYAGETAFHEVDFQFEEGTEVANNNYFKAIVRGTDFVTVGDVEYYFFAAYDDHDDTYLAAGGSGAGAKTYASAAEAQEHLFTMPVGDEAGKEPGYMWHAGNAVLAGTNAVQFWVKIGYTKDGVDWADTVEMRYNICTGAIPASVTAKGKRLSAKSYRTAAVRSAGDYTNTVSLVRDHEEEDMSEYGNSVWWMCTVTDDQIAESNTYIEYQIAAKNASANGNNTWRLADYRTASASNTFYYTMWQAGANELTVNGLNADYTTSKFFIDEAAIAAGTETAPVINVVYAPPVENAYAVEVFSNVGRRDYWKADIDGNGIPDAICPPAGDFYTTDVTNGYYLAQAMDRVGGKYTLSIPLEKTGAYRLTARYKATAADTWHYYSESGSGIRDHAVVVSPKKVLSQNVYELNALTVKADEASRSGRSTFADLINPSAEKQDTFDEFSIDYLNKIGANCLWFQPIHPATETGIDFDEGPGSPYAAKNYFAVARWFGKGETETNALAEFHDFVAACDRGYCDLTNRGYVGTVNIMLDGVFNHTSWDAILGERGVAMFAAKGETTYVDQNGQTQPITADTPIGHVRPAWYANFENYGASANFFWTPNWHNVATAPDRGDFGKWGDTAELFYGRYAALVEHNDQDNGNYLNESDWFDWSCMTNADGTAAPTSELWDYMGGYVEFWLEKTGHDFGNHKLGELDENGAAYDDYGIDGLRCDFGQGLPPQFWEYCINRARSEKWNFMFMAESLDGGVVSYRSNRHFDILNENFVFQSTGAGSPAALQNVVESRKSLYNGGAVLLNQTSHDEIMPYDDPWVTASRHAVNSTFMGLPMMFNGQEQGIVPLRGVDTTGKAEGWKAPGSILSGFTWHELNFGKLVPHFKSWNKLRIWDEPPSSVWASGAAEPEKESRYMAQWYGRINSARLRSPALRSGNQYYLGRYDYVVNNDWQYGGTYDNNSIFAVAKYEETGAADKGKDAVIAFARFMNAGDAHYAASETYAITDEVAALLGISRGKSYTARNLAATVAEDVLWTKTGDEIMDEGIWVNLTTGDGSNMYDDGALVQYLKIELASGIVFGDETNAVCGTATNLSLAIRDATGYGIAATANGEAFADFAYDATAGAISYTPSVAGTFVFTATATNTAGNVTTASATVTVAKGTPAVDVPASFTSEVGKTLGDVALPEVAGGTIAWDAPATAFTATGTVSAAAWTYTPTDTANWNEVKGTSSVVVGKGTRAFPPVEPLSGTYGTTLTLADVEGLPAGYVWEDAATAIAGAGTTNCPAIYNSDPANWFNAEGTIEVVVAKGTPVVETPTGLTSEVGKTLADVALPSGFAWKEPATVFTAAGTGRYEWTYTPEDTANWNTVDGISEVAVTGGEPIPAIHPRTTFIAVDLEAGTVKLAGDDYPEELSGNIWYTDELRVEPDAWTGYEGPVATNADGTFTIEFEQPFPSIRFFRVDGEPAAAP